MPTMTTTPTTFEEWRARFSEIEAELRAAEQEVQAAKFKAGRIKDQLSDCQRDMDAFLTDRRQVNYL
ncbi:hypothetical protein KOR34_45360 [Posidoniimonas corsicana]|uniref:Uncharacterized protein n=1 Tax=Posidoniimonas corsicana TaxID=1938618 RepID=A0A5C5UZW0_9BACT|nr:hypothetical protein [Posidoniimonas corsicana]TWT31160.1 hypothetical protein KOR34_45360 [Posidoniimonas corsicana]